MSKNKHSLPMTEDEIIDSVIYPHSFRANRKISRARMKDSFKISDSKRATTLPYEPYSGPIGGGNSYIKHKMTDDEIIDSVIHPEKHKHSQQDLRKLDPSCISDEVKEYWQQKINAGILRAAVLQKKNGNVTENLGSKTKPDIGRMSEIVRRK